VEQAEYASEPEAGSFGTAGHPAEPEAGSFRTADGDEANLFTLSHYPIDALCQICHGPIRARSFMLPFEHLNEGKIPEQRS
jgi:hypothetical protein